MKPALLTVDDDPQVLRAVARDLRRQYAERYRVLRADSGAAALEILRELKKREEPLALLLADQRMPQMSGTELIEASAPLFPDAKRALLTAYADTDAAISAINRARVDYYFMKPWDPPEEHLYPTLDDLLGDWQAAYRPPFRGIRVVGDRYSPETHRIKDFLARNQVPYRWLDVERSEEAHALLETAGLCAAEDAEAGDVEEQTRAALPLVFFPDEEPAKRPTNAALAERIGLRTQAQQPFYDLVVVGGGPAGLAAAVYGASEGLRTVLVEREAPGGQAGTSSRIENYLGFPAGLSGSDLARRAVAQARKFEAEILSPQEVASIRTDGTYHIARLTGGSEISCHALLIAAGVQYRTLDAPGVEALTGRGVYYGASMSEAVACEDEHVHIVGAGNSAGQAALYLASYAARVTMLVRAGSLDRSMSRYLIDQIERTANIDVQFRMQVQAACGEAHLERLVLVSEDRAEPFEVASDALFLFIGARPRTGWLDGFIARDERGFLLTGPDLAEHGRLDGWPLERDPFLLETSVPGIFATGDVRHRSVKRVAAAVGEGSVAVSFVHEYLANV